MDDLKKRIYEVAKEDQLLNLATITENGKPWVRYVSGKANSDLVFRFCTHLQSDKAREMRKDPNVHLSLGAKDARSAKNWLQVAGVAEISTSQNERDALWMDGLKAFFKGPDDPNFAVIIVRPTKIELGSMTGAPEVWTA
jgi:general stress protein 26